MNDKTIRLVLKNWEYQRLVSINVKGGQDGLKKRLLAKFVRTEDGWQIDLAWSEVGEILYHMGAYGEGGWQDCLRQNFTRPILKFAGVNQ